MELYSYNKFCVQTARKNLATLFEYAVYIEHEDLNKLFLEFILSGVAEEIELGKSQYIEGTSGVELYYLIKKKDIPEYASDFYMDVPSREYWLGYYLSFAQWYLNISYREIANCFTAKELLGYYRVYHEMDERSFAEDIYEIIKKSRNNLNNFRLYNHISQSILASSSSVNIRNIQMYEQNACDISKAQINILINLAKQLEVSVFDLINNMDLKYNMYLYAIKNITEYGYENVDNELLYLYMNNIPYDKFIKYNNQYYIRKEDFIFNAKSYLIHFFESKVVDKIIDKVLVKDSYQKFSYDIMIFDYQLLLDIIYTRNID